MNIKTFKKIIMAYLVSVVIGESIWKYDSWFTGLNLPMVAGYSLGIYVFWIALIMVLGYTFKLILDFLQPSNLFIKQ